MRGIRVSRSYLSLFSVLANTHMKSRFITRTQCLTIAEAAPTTIRNSINSCFQFHFSFFSTSNIEDPDQPKVPDSEQGFSNQDDGSDTDDGEDVEDFDVKNVRELIVSNEAVIQDAKVILDILCKTGSDRLEMKNRLAQCCIKASSELVVEVLSRVRHDWEVAFTFFLWAEKQPGYTHSPREYHSMIFILGKMRKFDTAWALIDEMRGTGTGPSLVTPQTLLIMIRRYCAVHDVGKAINTFYAYKRFKFDLGIEEFQSLLSALCRYKNVKEAEHLMFCNKDVFPFNTKSFNVILNGWCNIVGSPCEAERVWREMGKRGIQYDVVSYSTIMSCYSKASNLHKVFKLFDQMKKLRIEPDRKVYNAVVHALAKARLVQEAIDLMRTMEEKGIAPNVVTYNSLIKPLCKARKIDEARQVFDEMIQRDLSPTIHTYHAFFRSLRNGEEVFELLEKMKKLGCQPANDTYIMLIRKFSRWHHFDNAFKVWNEMSDNGVGPDRSSYIVLIHGLFLNGKLEEAYKFYLEMKEKNLFPDPKIDEMLKAWVSSKQFAQNKIAPPKGNLHCPELEKQTRVISKKLEQERDFLRQPETRRVVRERGFSFWE
ncbi:hypothetical protein SLEP1_g24523 [Rubroshorea leprosula]|uniref:Pentatricopeptide repeat-containing protein n=1 Tax=Rubroshorea leprosula TaxID=152421 RepID=A0AAV5JFZ0_9ROSI|nr:hypothetical protein SLEP1_g24523 [Rubroshorea leprosula]